MAEINLTQDHRLSPAQAHAAAQQVAQQLAQSYDLQCRWDGDVLRFERSGVQGALTLDAHSVHVHIRLGLVLGAFAPTIEAKVAASMKQVFGGGQG